MSKEFAVLSYISVLVFKDVICAPHHMDLIFCRLKSSLCRPEWMTRGRFDVKNEGETVTLCLLLSRRKERNAFTIKREARRCVGGSLSYFTLLSLNDLTLFV